MMDKLDLNTIADRNKLTS